MNILSGLINSNIFIALAALSLTVATQVQLGFEPEWHPYLFIIFFATLFEYNLHRLITIFVSDDALHSDKHAWVLDNKKKFYGVVLFSLVGFVISALLAEVKVLEVFSAIAFLTIFYSMPIGVRSKKLFRLREVPYLKLFIIAFVWSTTTVLLPVIHTAHEISYFDVALIVMERFIFVVAVTIPFDIRDLEVDKKVGLKTIPILIGEEKSYFVSYLFLAVFSLLAVFHYGVRGDNLTAFAFLTSGVATTFAVASKKLRESRWYHYGILDGMILLQGVLVVIINLKWDSPTI